MVMKLGMWWGFLCLYWLAIPAASIFLGYTAAVMADFLGAALAFGLDGVGRF